MKRYRDDKGRLTMTIEQVSAETLEEARAYYHSCAIYSYHGKEYTYNQEMYCFQSFDGYTLFIDPKRLGTFLPDVASAGEEIALLEDLT